MSPVMPDRPFEAAFMDNLREVARVTRSEGIEAAMLGPWASNPLFEFSFSKPHVREAAMAINRDFPGAEYLATQRDRIEREWTVPERLSEIDVATVVIAGDRETPGFRAYRRGSGRAGFLAAGSSSTKTAAISYLSKNLSGLPRRLSASRLEVEVPGFRILES